jgi:saccharopine dehydrogenase (NADP+, L-glutamate forming)
MDGIASMTHNDFVSSFLDSGKNVQEEICRRFGLSLSGEEMKRLNWSGFFSTEKVGLEKATPAQALEHILNKKWKLKSGDKDFIVMWHRFKYLLNGKEKEIQAWLTVTGEDEIYTAMAKTVGLPVAIATKLLLQNKFQSRGVAIPVTPEFYNPILSELKELGIGLSEKES